MANVYVHCPLLERIKRKATKEGIVLDLYTYCFTFFLLCLHLVEDAQLTPLLRLGAGACAGIIAMSATYPMDMVRGRLTVQVYSLFLYKALSH